MNERFYSINDITEMFGVTRTAVYDWMNAGKLDFIVVGARRRVLQSHLDAFIQEATRRITASTTSWPRPLRSVGCRAW